MLPRSTDGDWGKEEGIVLLVLGSDLGGATIGIFHVEGLLGVTIESANTLGRSHAILAKSVDERFGSIGLVGRIAENVDAGGSHCASEQGSSE